MLPIFFRAATSMIERLFPPLPAYSILMIPLSDVYRYLRSFEKTIS